MWQTPSYTTYVTFFINYIKGNFVNSHSLLSLFLPSLYMYSLFSNPSTSSFSPPTVAARPHPPSTSTSITFSTIRHHHHHTLRPYPRSPSPAPPSSVVTLRTPPPTSPTVSPLDLIITFVAAVSSSVLTTVVALASHPPIAPRSVVGCFVANIREQMREREICERDM